MLEISTSRMESMHRSCLVINKNNFSCSSTSLHFAPPLSSPGLLVVASSVAGELEDFRAEVLEDGGKVDAGANTDAGGVATLLQVAANTGDRELKPGLARGADGLSGAASSLSLSFSFSCVCVGDSGR